MGGQSSRLGVMNKEGRLESFDFNEKCASGSGKVLENVAYVLHVSFDRLSQLSANSNKAVSFTTSCAVFAESETITAVAKGERVENIIAGFHQSIAIKLSAMIAKNKIDDAPIFAVGGMAIDSALIVALEDMIGKKITVLENLQHCVAMGAALLARDRQLRQ
jgi:predicted CoA-substrate-specific enzyme activase